MMRLFGLLYVIVAALHGGYHARASPCDGSPEKVTVDHTPKKIYSPGYPNHYANNIECDWVFEVARNAQQSGFGIQLATLELELDPQYATTMGKCDDYLEAFEGTPSSLGRSLGSWCEGENKVIKALTTSVTLRFHSSHHYTGKGFVLEYSLVRVASAECLPGRTTPVHVGRAPLYETFTVKNTENSCTWRMETVDQNGAPDPNSSLVIEAFNVPKVYCSAGTFIIYDGPDSKSPKILQWCNTGKAFSTIYLSSGYGTLTFHFEDGEHLEADVSPIQLKMYSRDIKYECVDTSMPSIHVGLNPVYFALPFASTASGEPCDVHVSQRDRANLRVDVMAISGQQISCHADVVSVRRAANKAEVGRACNRRRYPMYLPSRSDVIVRPKVASKRVYLRAIAIDEFCSGQNAPGHAYDDLIREYKLPQSLESKDAPDNCYSRLLITAKRENRAVSLYMRWNLDYYQERIYSETDACEGDFVNVYDGSDESSPLLFSSCRRQDRPDKYIDKKIIGTQGQMLVLMNTDDSDGAKQVMLETYAVPLNADECKEVQYISVNGTEQNLTSPNYPDFFPLDYACVYELTAENENEEIVIEVVDTKFTAGCGDILNIYDGQSAWKPEDLIGRVCGHDRLSQFVSKQHQAVIRFNSNKYGSSGGWRLMIYSRQKEPSGACQNNGGLIMSMMMLVVSVVVMSV